MASIVTDCPHCPATRAAFTVEYSKQEPLRGGPRFNVFARCPACGNGLGASVYSDDYLNPVEYQGNLVEGRNDGFLVEYAYPSRQKLSSPENVPERVDRSFLEGVQSLRDGRFNAAGVMFRRCLDIGLNSFEEAGRGNLKQRIDALAAAGKITAELQTLAHRVRIAGNEAAHDDDDFTQDQATQLHEFTSLFLTYVFTLPAKVRQTLAAAAGE